MQSRSTPTQSWWRFAPGATSPRTGTSCGSDRTDYSTTGTSRIPIYDFKLTPRQLRPQLARTFTNLHIGRCDDDDDDHYYNLNDGLDTVVHLHKETSTSAPLPP